MRAVLQVSSVDPKTYALDDIIVVVMRGSGFTPLEKTIIDSGAPERVVDMRHDFQRCRSARPTIPATATTTRLFSPTRRRRRPAT